MIVLILFRMSFEEPFKELQNVLLMELQNKRITALGKANGICNFL